MQSNLDTCQTVCLVTKTGNIEKYSVVFENTGKPLVEIELDMREPTDLRKFWDRLYDMTGYSKVVFL